MAVRTYLPGPPMGLGLSCSARRAIDLPCREARPIVGRQHVDAGEFARHTRSREIRFERQGRRSHCNSLRDPQRFKC